MVVQSCGDEPVEVGLEGAADVLAEWALGGGLGVGVGAPVHATASTRTSASAATFSKVATMERPPRPAASSQ